MCEPTTAAIIMAAASIGSSYAGYEGAKAQYKMQNAMHEQNKLNAYASMRQGYSALQERQQQESQAASQQIQARQLEAVQQAASANVAAGEAGVSGFSVERVLRDVGAVASRDITTIQQNRDWSISQIQNEMRGVKNQTKSQIASVPKGIKPKALPYIFQAAGGSAQAYGSYKAMGG